jgi:bis(5'-nucleosyl)-tetraphosphatase (symmetrical)
MAVYAIGDVQGCFSSLMYLLDVIAFDRTRDRLWFAGDLVNRGPRSLEVLRFVKALGDAAVTVLGNHDLRLLGVASGRVAGKPRDTLAEVVQAPDCHELMDWLRQQPLIHVDAALGMAMVHAGLPPQWTLGVARDRAAEVETLLRGADYPTFLEQIAGNAVAHESASPGSWERLCYTLNALTRLRYCDARGRLDLDSSGPPGTQPAPYVPWFQLPHRAHASQPLVFGHWSTLGSCTVPGVYPLDTGCVWGRELTALCLDTKVWTRVPCQERGGQSACSDIARS